MLPSSLPPGAMKGGGDSSQPGAAAQRGFESAPTYPTLTCRRGLYGGVRQLTTGSRPAFCYGAAAGMRNGTVAITCDGASLGAILAIQSTATGGNEFKVNFPSCTPSTSEL